MLAWTVEAAKKSGVFSKIVVSSEDEYVLNICDGIIQHKRPRTLCSPRASVFDVAVDVVKNFKEDFSILLPSSPFRTAEDIRKAHKLFISSKTDCLMSVVPYDHPPEWALEIRGNNKLGWWHGDYINKRQDLSTKYRHDGSIIMCKMKAFATLANSKMAGEWIMLNPIPFLIKPSHAIDINTEEDFGYCEYISRSSS